MQLDLHLEKGYGIQYIGPEPVGIKILQAGWAYPSIFK